jgi:hypothetical protein
MRKVVDLVKFHWIEASLGFSYDGPSILQHRKEVIEYNIMLDSEFDSCLIVLTAVKNWYCCIVWLNFAANCNAQSQDWVRSKTSCCKALWTWCTTFVHYTGCAGLLSANLFPHTQTMAWDWRHGSSTKPYMWSTVSSELWWHFLPSTSHKSKPRLFPGRTTRSAGNQLFHICALHNNSLSSQTSRESPISS